MSPASCFIFSKKKSFLTNNSNAGRIQLPTRRTAKISSFTSTTIKLKNRKTKKKHLLTIIFNYPGAERYQLHIRLTRSLKNM